MPTTKPYDLESFLRSELAEGKIDFALRARIDETGNVRFYAHPAGKDGQTTPEVFVQRSKLTYGG